MSENYVYLFVREDLSRPQQIIQASHATHIMTHNMDSWEIENPAHTNAVLIGAVSEDHLLAIKQYLDENDIENEIFYEPDIAAYTALTTYPLKGKERKPLQKFNLMA